jgi:putative holliday junction resolvase
MEEYGRIMALDIGDVRTGVALSDPMRIIASPHAVVPMASTDQAIENLCAMIRETEAVLVVAGLPLNQNGEPGPQAEKVLAFVEQLRQRVDIDIVTQDERFSTAAAERSLIAADMRRAKRKKVIDKVAATHILQAYLDRMSAAKRLKP